MKTRSTTGYVLVTLLLFWLGTSTGYGQGRTHTVQVASVNSEVVARETVAAYRAHGIVAYYVKVELPQGTFYRVRVGRFATPAEAQRYVRAIGIPDAFITVYDGPADAALTRASALAASPPSLPRDDLSAAAPESNAPAKPLPPPVMVIKPKGKAAPLSTVKSLPDVTRTPVDGQATGGHQDNADPAATGTAPVSTTVSGRQLLRQTARPAMLLEELAAPKMPAEAIFYPDTSPWVQLPTPTRADLLCAHFISPEKGWVCGKRGTILYTEDGGRYWVEQVTGTKAHVTSLFFLNAQTGWAAAGGSYGLDPVVDGIEPTILRTDDGGRIWRPLAGLDVRSLWFVNEHVGFAVGNYSSVFRTTDGGATWTACEGLRQAIERPAGLPDAVLTFTLVQFLDERRGWVAGNFFGRGITRPAGVFWTQDGGETWTRYPIPFAPTSAEITSMHFLDARRGSVVSELYRGDARFVTLHFTNDGGATWSERRMAVPGFHVTHFLDERTGWTIGAVLSRDSLAPPYEVGIWATRDGGRTWREEKTLAGTKIYGVFFLDPQTGWAVGQGGTVLRYRPRLLNP